MHNALCDNKPNESELVVELSDLKSTDLVMIKVVLCTMDGW